MLHKRKNLRGFTLIELLVVVAVITVLISILMPALNGARQSALTTRCAASLRMIATASLVYAGENSDTLPPCLVNSATGSNPHNPPRYYNSPSAVPNAYDSIGGLKWTNFLQQIVKPLTNATYLPVKRDNARAVLCCPVAPRSDGVTGIIGHYAWNGHLN